MKVETSPVLVLDSFTALRLKSYFSSYQRHEAYDNAIVQKAKQKGLQKAPQM